MDYVALEPYAFISCSRIRVSSSQKRSIFLDYCHPFCSSFPLLDQDSRSYILFNLLIFLLDPHSCFLILRLETEPENSESARGESVSVFQLLSSFGIAINILVTFTAFMNIGFNDATLEHHIRDVSLLLPYTTIITFRIRDIVYLTVSYSRWRNLPGFGCHLCRLFPGMGIPDQPNRVGNTIHPLWICPLPRIFPSLWTHVPDPDGAVSLSIYMTSESWPILPGILQ